MATRRLQAFAGAHAASFYPLGKDYVEWFLHRVEAAGLVTLAAATAEIEIQAVEDAGELAVLVFSRIAGGQSRGLYGADALAAFSQALGRDITTNDVTPAIDRLIAANLVVRKGHGSFDVADPFVQRVWLQHVLMRRTLSSPTGDDSQRESSSPA